MPQGAAGDGAQTASPKCFVTKEHKREYDKVFHNKLLLFWFQALVTPLRSIFFVRAACPSPSKNQVGRDAFNRFCPQAPRTLVTPSDEAAQSADLPSPSVTTKLTGLATPDLEQSAVMKTSLMSRSFSSLTDASTKFPGISFTRAIGTDTCTSTR